MAYSDIQQTEFNRATENLIEITWTYVNLQKEFPKLSETDSMGWKQMVLYSGIVGRKVYKERHTENTCRR